MSASLVAVIDSELSVEYAFRELSLDEIDQVGGGGWWGRLVAWVGGVWQVIQEWFSDDPVPAPSQTIIINQNGEGTINVTIIQGCGCGGD